MVRARRAFLQAGHYQPIASQLVTMVQQHCTARGALSWCDIGCGEGYYTTSVQSALSTQTDALAGYGIDISKPAIQVASQGDSSGVTWLVASGAQLPLAEHSQDLALCLFTRLMPESFWQVLKPKGVLVVAVAGAQHLLALRQGLYGHLKPQRELAWGSLLDHFELLDEQRVQYRRTLTESDDIASLIAMTPHQWRSTESAREAVIHSGALEMDVDVRLVSFRAMA